jgi:hypothetical protein
MHETLITIGFIVVSALGYWLNNHIKARKAKAKFDEEYQKQIDDDYMAHTDIRQ